MSKFKTGVKQQTMTLEQNSVLAYDSGLEASGSGEPENSNSRQSNLSGDTNSPPPGHEPPAIRIDNESNKQSGDLNPPGGRASPIISATALLAAKYPSHFISKNERRSRIETRVAMLVTALLAGLIFYGWSTWSQINFRASFNFTYNSGLIGGILMLLTLVYALRKRLKILRKAGGMEGWYYFHLIGGVIGPFFIIFHSHFSLRSVNSTMAFVAMMLVVISGLFGRYIYTRIGYGLQNKIEAINETETSLLESIRKYKSDVVENIERRLATFALNCLAGPKSFFKLPLRFLAIRAAAAGCYVSASDDMAKILKSQAQAQGWSVQVYKNLLDEEKRLLREHINAVVEIAYVHVFERVLVRWRVLHIPLLYILFITGCAHVLAVHLY